MVVMLAFALGIVIMLARWEVFDGDKFVALANERFRDIRLPALRGSILASDGTSLGFSEPRFDLFAWLPEIEDAEKRGFQTKEEFGQAMSELLQVDQKSIADKLASGPLWIKLADKLTVDQRDKILNAKLPGGNRNIQGIELEYVNKRIYPESKLASQVLGFVGFNTSGQEVGVGGLEQYWEGSLKPQEGFESGEVDSFGNPIALSDSVPLEAKPGDTITTTINKSLQAILEQKLTEGMATYKAASATGLIMDPKTGKIMALANAPDFDPNTYFDEKDGTVFGNKAVSYPYEIGSVGKVFTLSAALDLGTLEPDTLVLPEGHRGCEIISPDPPEGARCLVNDPNIKVDCICTYDRKPNATPLTAKMAFVNSDNIGFRHIALTMSYQQFYDYLRKYGVGTSTGIELAGESTGVLTPVQKWNYADQAVFSYGHSYQMTPLQVIAAVAAVDNDGQRMQPYIVQKIEQSDGQVTEFNPKILENVIRPATAETMITIMHQVYENTLIEKDYKKLKDYYIGLKSGTALIPFTDKPGYSGEINATYVGFDASPDRKFVMLIKLEKPQVGGLSIDNVRKLWLDTFVAIKDYLGVKPYTH